MYFPEASQSLSFPYSPPHAATVTEVAPGVLWTRVPLPFQLNHVNIYLIEDHNGWAVLDTGIDDAATRAIWEALLAGPLVGRRLTQVIVTHYHPDHIGLAGWLAKRFDLPVLTSYSSYLTCLNISLNPSALEARPHTDFYLRHGMSKEAAAQVATQGQRYLDMVWPLPSTFSRLGAGDTLTIGGRRFDILAGEGHAPEQLMLYCAEEKLFFAADQVLARITPNISVSAFDPEGDPLGLYLRSLQSIRDSVPEDALVLPGHELPFHGLHHRCLELITHHEERCSLIAEACTGTLRSVADLVPLVFSRPLDAHQMSFAFSEVLAHVNTMLRRGDLVWTGVHGEIMRLVSV
jgi:glyoxylase-like metal-dependent hydrolase (beta-lactamase superfamily II)